MGSFLNAAKRHRPSGSARSFVAGASVVAIGAGVSWLAANWVRRRFARREPSGWVIEGVVLKPTFSLRALLEAGRGVAEALEDGDLDMARQRLARDLVSRDTDALGPEQIASAAIESVAENFVDSVVAPLCAYSVGGLPAAYAYRFINTADAVLGYRTDELEWFGKTAARTDDAANLLPARAGAWVLSASRPKPEVVIGVAEMREEASKASSPNSGWPMAAVALGLDVRLEKPGVYVINRTGRLPNTADIRDTIAWVERASLLVTAGVALAEGVQRRW